MMLIVGVDLGSYADSQIQSPSLEQSILTLIFKSQAKWKSRSKAKVNGGNDNMHMIKR